MGCNQKQPGCVTSKLGILTGNNFCKLPKSKLAGKFKRDTKRQLFKPAGV